VAVAARLGQGAAASAFSSAASTLVARLRPVAEQGRAFGSYGLALGEYPNGNQR
jgi:MFS family permease